MEVNAHFDVRRSKWVWSSMLKTSLHQDIHLYVFCKIKDIGTDKVFLLFRILGDTFLNSKISGMRNLIMPDFHFILTNNRHTNIPN